MKIKTAETTPLQLDWLVATAEGYSGWDGECFTRYSDDYPGAFFLSDWKPSTNWAQGGPIIEREKISPIPYSVDGAGWFACKRPLLFKTDGPTPLIAAMRCFVASNLGDEVDIPEELK